MAHDKRLAPMSAKRAHVFTVIGPSGHERPGVSLNRCQLADTFPVADVARLPRVKSSVGSFAPNLAMDAADLHDSSSWGE